MERKGGSESGCCVSSEKNEKKGVGIGPQCSINGNQKGGTCVEERTKQSQKARNWEGESGADFQRLVDRRFPFAAGGGGGKSRRKTIKNLPRAGCSFQIGLKQGKNEYAAVKEEGSKKKGNVSEISKNFGPSQFRAGEGEKGTK